MTTITQDMRYRLSLIKYAEKHGVSKAADKYHTNRQYIYRWKRRYDGSAGRAIPALPPAYTASSGTITISLCGHWDGKHRNRY